jgi:hypothetical protein
LKVQRGCECDGRNCQVHYEHDAKTAPVIKLVEREGKKMKVCSRCDLRSDTVLEWLVDIKSPFKPYFDYDPFTIALLDKIGLTDAMENTS